ncbi:MAG: bifunctional phosphoribosyl-AMP cyclohydrolase/phosphoribosyl-ATP diphosphatase HisIE [Lachnospiraceae bacterium]|nr:bifunctional phosphoribosyl-AMP cyclohydrolase/phosphoribosyl-ATP diphosphatase HisIE [Lachnospiraceae bacterium]
MKNKLKLIPSVYLYGGKIADIDALERAAEASAVSAPEDAASYCTVLCHSGADELLIFDLSDDDAGHEANLALLKDIADAVDIPILAGGNVKRLEDVKKYIYAGASRAILNMSVAANEAMIQEASARFGKDRIAVYSARVPKAEEACRWAEQGAGLLILEQEICPEDAESDRRVAGIGQKKCPESFSNLLTEVEISILWMTNIQPDVCCKNIMDLSASSDARKEKSEETESAKGSETDNLYGISLAVFRDTAVPLMQYKHRFAEAGLNVFLLESPRPFSEFKKNSDGLLPVIVQDYQTNEVLMLAYMNEEAFQHTLACGRMTYYSRSRRELWEKGLTSGHFQYVKSLSIDCDDDTLLAKVYQVGAACHTGNRSCFYRDLVPGADQANPLTVFDDVYRVILDRKEHPKEGSYTNYLFDKGIDKILKKVGEEATEIVIAAKNPDPKETVYEISDLLYHMMVLMAEKGISWKEVTTELARR